MKWRSNITYSESSTAAKSRRSAKGAEYDSQGQARSASPLDNTQSFDAALKGRNIISALQALTLLAFHRCHIARRIWGSIKANQAWKNGCAGWEHDDALQQEAEKILKQRYPSSPWTAKLRESEKN